MRHLKWLAGMLLASLPLFAQSDKGSSFLLQVQQGGVQVTGATFNKYARINFASGCTAVVSGGSLNITCAGGAGNPGGADTQIEFNSGGAAFGGITQFTTNGTTTITAGATAILNLSAAGVTTGLKFPSGAGAAPTADGQAAFDTTAHLPVFGSNGTTLKWPATFSASANNYVTGYNQVTGVFTQARPTCGNLSDSVASCNTDTTQAGNITGGTLPNGRISGLPLANLATQGSDTLVMNATGGTAVPTAVAAPAGGTNGCAGTTDSPTYNSTTHAWGCHQISGVGTVTSVAASVPSGLAVSGSPVTGSGTLNISWSVAAGGGIITSTGVNTAGFSSTPVLGVPGTTGGTLGLANGGGSGATITVQNLGATSSYNFNLPDTPGSSGQSLVSQGGGVSRMTWASSLTNPMNTAADIIIGGSAGAAIRLAAPTSPDGVPYFLTSSSTAGVGNPPSWALPGVVPRLVTSSSDTIAATDRGGIVVNNSASPVSTALPSAASFGSNFTFLAVNQNAAVTITPATSTITECSGFTCQSGLTSLSLPTGSYCGFTSDNTNYVARCVGVDTLPTAAYAANSVTNAKLATMTTHTIKGNSTGGTATPTDLSIAAVNTMLGISSAQGVPNAGNGTIGVSSLAFGVDCTQFQGTSSTDIGAMFTDCLASGQVNNIGPTVRIPTNQSTGQWTMNTDPFAGATQRGMLVRQEGVTLVSDVTIALPNKSSWEGNLRGDSGNLSGATNAAIQMSTTWKSTYPNVSSASGADEICLVQGSNVITAGTAAAGVCSAGSATPFTSNLVGYMLYIFPHGTFSSPGLVGANVGVPVGIVGAFTDNKHVNLIRNVPLPIAISSNGEGYLYKFIKPAYILGMPTPSSCPGTANCIANQSHLTGVTVDCNDNTSGDANNTHIGIVNVYGQEQVYFRDIGVRNCGWAKAVIGTTGAQDSGPYSMIGGGNMPATGIDWDIWQPGYMHGIEGQNTIVGGATNPTSILIRNTINGGGFPVIAPHDESAVDAITCGDLLSFSGWVTGGTGCRGLTVETQSSSSSITNSLHIVAATGSVSKNIKVCGLSGNAGIVTILNDLTGESINLQDTPECYQVGTTRYATGVSSTNVTVPVKQGASGTQFNLQCQSAADTVANCGASPSVVYGALQNAYSTSGGVILEEVVKLGKVPINASAAVTLGHTVCAGSSAGQVTDSGGTGNCGSAPTIGVVRSVSGPYLLPDGTTATLSTTLPLIEMGVYYGAAASGTVNSGTATHIPYYASSTNALTDSGADLTFDGTHTWAFGTAGILKVPASTGLTSAADGQLAYDTTAKLMHQRTNGADSISTATVGTSNVTNQAASQTTVTVATSPTAGQYQLEYYVRQNVLCTTGSNSVNFTFSWTDDVGATSQVTGALTLTNTTAGGPLSGVIPMQVGSGNVTYISTVSGSCGSGSSSYNIHAALVRLQ